MVERMTDKPAAAIFRKGPLTDDQSACVDLLQQALEMAEDGKVDSVCMVVCMTNGWATVMAGRRAGDLNLGCDDIKAKILAEVTSGNVARGASKIIRVKS